MPSALSFPDQTRRLRLEIATQPSCLDEACLATGQNIAASSVDLVHASLVHFTARPFKQPFNDEGIVNAMPD